MGESEAPETTATSDASPADEPRGVTNAETVGGLLWLAGLAGATVAAPINSALLMRLSVGVFVLGGVLRGVVALDRRWRRESETKL